MSNGRILDHHWVERTKAGQTAWQDSTMPMMERRLLSALRSPMKVSDLYRKFADADSQAFLDLMNLLNRRGWVTRIEEPLAPVEKAVEVGSSVPLPVSTLLPTHRSIPPVLPEVERPKLSEDLLATLDRYRNSSSSEDAPETPPASPPAPNAKDPELDQAPRDVDDAAVRSNPSMEHDHALDESPAPLIIDRLSSSALTLLDLLKDPAEEPALDASKAPSPPAGPAATDEPSEQVGPLTVVDRDPSAKQTPERETIEAPLINPPMWDGMGSLSALERALREPDVSSPKDLSVPVQPPAVDVPVYVFDREEAAARLARSLQEQDVVPPMLDRRETVGEALPLHTLPKADMIPWEHGDERSMKGGASVAPTTTVEASSVPDHRAHAPLGNATHASPAGTPSVRPIRAIDVGPKGPDPIEDEDDLMQQLSRPRKLKPSTITATGPASRTGTSRKSAGATRPRGNAFQQELQRLQAMKDEAVQQEQARQDLIARKKAEEAMRRMAEEARRASIAQARAEAQRREDAQSLSSLSERMKRIKRNKDSS